jgi:hypothetical protein
MNQSTTSSVCLVKKGDESQNNRRMDLGGDLGEDRDQACVHCLAAIKKDGFQPNFGHLRLAQVWSEDL